jgi:hypothetical protein
MAHLEDNPISRAIASALDLTYDRVAMKRDGVLEAAQEFDLGFKDWDEYQRRAGAKLMNDTADRYISNCKLQVSSLGAAAGFGGYLAIIPDALQFVGFTLRMVTGIAAAYGFDPDPDYLSGKVKVLVLQAYLNGSAGNAQFRGAEKMTLSAVTKALARAATRSQFLLTIIVAIARLLGVRISKQWLLKSIPLVASGANAGFNWLLARQIGNSAKAEFRQFREDIRIGKYKDDPDYSGLGA